MLKGVDRPNAVRGFAAGRGVRVCAANHVDDAAGGIVVTNERRDEAEPAILAFGREITIRDLVGLIARLTDFTGEIRWDPTEPDGQPRRLQDTSRAREQVGFEMVTPFADGMQATIDRYLQRSETQLRRSSNMEHGAHSPE
jgi:GDP-L-fucose synthase